MVVYVIYFMEICMQEIINDNPDIWGSEPILFPDEPLKKKLLRNGFRLYFFSALIAPTGYIIKIISSHSLSVAELWLFYSILGIITLISNYSDLGLTEALQYYLPHYFLDKEYNKVKSILFMTCIVQVVSWISMAFILFLITPWLVSNYFHSSEAIMLLYLFCFYFILNNIFSLLQSVFLSTQKIKISQGIDTIRMRSIVLLCILWRSWKFFNLYFLVIFWLLGIIVAIIVGSFYLYKHFNRLKKSHFEWNKSLLLKQWKYGVWVMIWANAYLLLWQLDQQFALYFFGKESAGYWTNYVSLFNSINMVSAPLLAYLFPLLNELRKKNEWEKIALLNKLLYIWFITISVIFAVIMYIRWPQVAVLFFWEKFRYSGELLRIWGIFAFLVPINTIQFQNLASHGKVKQRVLLLFFGLIINLIANLILMPIVGIVWLIYWTAIGLTSMIIVSFYLQKKKY